MLSTRILRCLAPRMLKISAGGNNQWCEIPHYSRAIASIQLASATINLVLLLVLVSHIVLRPQTIGQIWPGTGIQTSLTGSRRYGIFTCQRCSLYYRTKRKTRAVNGLLSEGSRARKGSNGKDAAYKQDRRARSLRDADSVELVACKLTHGCWVAYKQHRQLHLLAAEGLKISVGYNSTITVNVFVHGLIEVGE